MWGLHRIDLIEDKFGHCYSLNYVCLMIESFCLLNHRAFLHCVYVLLGISLSWDSLFIITCMLKICLKIKQIYISITLLFLRTWKCNLLFLILTKRSRFVGFTIVDCYLHLIKTHPKTGNIKADVVVCFGISQMFFS